MNDNHNDWLQWLSNEEFGNSTQDTRYPGLAKPYIIKLDERFYLGFYPST